MANSPRIDQIQPPAAIPGGELQIRGAGLAAGYDLPQVMIGEVPAHLVAGSPSLVIAKVPEGATVGEVTVNQGGALSHPYLCEIGVQIADGLHPVGNPAVDSEGNIYATLSGSRGQKTPVSVYRLDLNLNQRPHVSDVMNATGVVVDSEDHLFVSSRYDGIVYRVSPSGNASVHVEGMGVATGMTLDGEGNLYVGDRSGTIFKISQDRQIYVFATMEPSIAAYHLAFGRDGNLYVTGPTTSSFDCVYRVAPNGDVEVFYRGLGRPQGLAFDEDSNLYVAASLAGRRGVVRIDPQGQAQLYVSGSGIVGVAFTPQKAMVLATTNALYRLDSGIRGLRL